MPMFTTTYSFKIPQSSVLARLKEKERDVFEMHWCMLDVSNIMPPSHSFSLYFSCSLYIKTTMYKNVGIKWPWVTINTDIKDSIQGGSIKWSLRGFTRKIISSVLLLLLLECAIIVEYRFYMDIKTTDVHLSDILPFIFP